MMGAWHPEPHWHSDEVLVRQAVRNARNRGRVRHQRWVVVCDAFAIGSTMAAALCRRFDLDPEEMI